MVESKLREMYVSKLLHFTDAVEIAVDEEPERVGDRCRLQCRRPSYSPCTQGATCREVHWNISGVLVINSEFYRLAFSDLICVASLNVVTRPEHDDAVFQCRIDFVKADNSNLTCYSEPVSFQLKGVLYFYKIKKQTLFYT